MDATGVVEQYLLWLDGWAKRSWAELRTMPYRRRLTAFHNIHSDRKRCVIIGNGPSIQRQDLQRIRGEITFATNWFAKKQEFDTLGINYYCMSDPKLWRDGHLPVELYTKLNSRRDIIKFFEYTFSLPWSRESLFPGHSVNFVKVNCRKKVYNGNFCADISKQTFHGHSVIIDLCLPIAFYMGFSEVYLIGCDSDYGYSNADVMDYAKAYFYQIDHASQIDDLEFQTKIWPRLVFGSYRVVKEFFESHGRRIFNAGLGGRLEVFERGDYEKVFR